jgi:hypothetical protein
MILWLGGKGSGRSLQDSREGCDYLKELDGIQEHLPAGQGNVVKTSAQNRAYLVHEFPLAIVFWSRKRGLISRWNLGD